jgi:hypothetical protein
LIPHPLTLLFCWLLGTGLSSGLGYVLEFIVEIFADAVRFGWIDNRFFTVVLASSAAVATFAGGLFTGAAMRLVAEKSWPRAAGWAFLAVFLAALIGSSASPSIYPAVSLALLKTPRFYLWAPAGCALGAYLCHRFREERWLEGAEGFMRNWMFWERGGAL